MSDVPSTPSGGFLHPNQSFPASSGAARFTPPLIEALNLMLPQFEFVDLIGAGGMGAVYKVRQPKLNRFVAIKILPPVQNDELGFGERFEREAQSMAQLSHPHIVSVFDFGETVDGHRYFVMEYVEGADLHRLISGGQLTLEHFFGWMPQVCDAIQYAHDHGIIHRDIKPANILIDRDGRVKIADFGLAKLTGSESLTALTRSDLSMGTPDYAAPEQIDGSSPVDWRSDIYSLGVVMYQMLTGRLPRGAFPLPSERTPGVDKRLDEVVIRAMQSEPAFRFQRASEIGHRISEIWSQPVAAEPIRGSTPATPKAQAAPRPSASLFPLVGGIVAASLLAGLALLYARHERSAESQPRQPGPAIPKELAFHPPKPEKSSSINSDPTEKARGKEKSLSPSRPMDPSMRDFTRRAGPGTGEANPPNLAAFRDKLGSRRPFGEKLDSLRRQQANLIVLSKDGEPLKGDPLSNMPSDLRPVVRFAIGQGPRGRDGPAPYGLALQNDGKVLAWGNRASGRCDVPSDLSGVIDIAAGPLHALALRGDGTVIAWGANDAGQCEVPPGLSGVADIAAGVDFSVALLENGSVSAWGSGAAGASALQIAKVKKIAAGFTHALALREDGSIVAWGGNEFGQADSPPLTGVKSISASFNQSFALLSDGRLISWGAPMEEKAVAGELPSKLASIHGSGGSLIARDLNNRLIIQGHRHHSGGLPSLLKQLPGEVRIETSEKLLFAYRPVELRAGGQPAPEATAAELPESPPPAPAPLQLSEAGRQIEDLQAKFEQAYVDQVSQPHEESLRRLSAFYLNHLEEKQSEASAASRLEEAVAWRTEAERVRAGEPLPEVDDPSLPNGLIELRRTYRENAAAHEEARNQSEAALLTKYDEALQTIQDRFTQEQKLDEALEVKAHREQRQQDH